MKNCMVAGRAPRPTIHLQPPFCRENSQPTTYATTCPPVTKRLDTVTSLPRIGPGLNSDMYSGTTNDALPTAAPTIERPAIIPLTLLVHACSSAPDMKRISAISMTLLRPYASANTPVSGDASRAKRDVLDVIRLLSSVVSSREERSVFMETRVEDITPVLGLLVFSTCKTSGKNEHHFAERR